MARPKLHYYESESRTTASEQSHHSDVSYRSQSTASTDYSDRQVDYNSHRRGSYDEEQYQQYPRDRRRESTQSVGTYVSTDDEEEGGLCHVGELPNEAVLPSNAIASTPRDFGYLFPSTKTMTIQHDSTKDGNENLRIDTEVVTRGGSKVTMTLFHLRMHNLNTREFSLLRYHRNSGVELCNSIRKYKGSERPGLQRALTSTIGALRSMTESRPSSSAGLSRTDSGYGSTNGIVSDKAGPDRSTPKNGDATKTINISSHNYGRFGVTRDSWNGCYKFEHWNVTYTWEMHVRNEGGIDRVWYNLFKSDSEKIQAQIWPKRLSSEERLEEFELGGLVPISHFRIIDESLLTNTAEVTDYVFSSGLIALVDDSIKRRSGPKRTTLEVDVRNPFSKSGHSRKKWEVGGPTKLIDHVLNRSSG